MPTILTSDSEPQQFPRPRHAPAPASVCSVPATTAGCPLPWPMTLQRRAAILPPRTPQRAAMAPQSKKINLARAALDKVEAA